jgi:TPR repeat protein
MDGAAERQARVEAHFLRVSRLRAMDAGELRALLAGDPAKAAPFIESAARYGIVEAQVRLAQMRLDGTGVPRDEADALAWFTRAAEAGSAEAMNMVGRCFENGWGAARDLANAATWYRRAAEAGCDWGQYNLGNLLFDGRGVPCDRRAALALYLKAAEQGHGRAMNLAARCLEEGWGAPRDRAASLAWYRRGAEAGYFRAQFNWATILAAHGEMALAIEWFEKALAGATPDSRSAMAGALARQGDPRLAAVAEAAMAQSAAA